MNASAENGSSRAIDQAANMLLATRPDGTAVHGPDALRAALVKVALGLAQRGVDLPGEVITLVGEVAATAGVMEGQPASQMHAKLELFLEGAMPAGAAALMDHAFVEATAHGPVPLLRFAAVMQQIVAAGGGEQQKKPSERAGPLARTLLAKEKLD